MRNSRTGFKGMSLGLALLAAWLWLLPGEGRGSGAATLDLGSQPLAVPITVFSEVLRRDRLLQADLAVAGLSLRIHDFATGGDTPGQFDGTHLEAALLDDMSALFAAAHQDAVIVGLLKQGFAAVVAKHYMRLNDLKGRRVALAPGSGAHYTLLQGLRSAGLSTTDVELVPMAAERMPQALADGEIEVFAAWEPTPSIALETVADAAVVYRRLNASYLVLARRFLEGRPEAARALGAALLRTLNWLNRSQANLEQAGRWVLQSTQAFSGDQLVLDETRIVALIRREVLEVAGLPLMPPRHAGADSTLAREFAFLQGIGKLPREISWEKIAASLDTRFLRDIAGQGERYRLAGYSYVQE